MTKKILAGCMAAVILCGLAYYSGFLYSERQLMEEQEKLLARLRTLSAEETDLEQEIQEKALEEEKEKAPAGSQSVSSEKEEFAYYLVEENGKIVIYLGDRTTLYEYTDIDPQTIPEELLKEIRAGKGIEGERELYDFLENYSS